MSRVEFLAYYVHEELKARWKENLKNLSKHALLLGTSEELIGQHSNLNFEHYHTQTNHTKISLSDIPRK